MSRAELLAAIYGGLATDPSSGTRLALTATAEIDREEWGLTWNQALETGGVLVGRTVTTNSRSKPLRSKRIRPSVRR